MTITTSSATLTSDIATPRKAERRNGLIEKFRNMFSHNETSLRIV